MLLISYVVMVQIAKGIIKTTGKTAQIAGLLKQLGIKNFKPEDLRSEKLDDVGFGRLVVLIREVQGGGQSNPMSQLMGLIQMQQGLTGLAGAAQQSPQVARPSQSSKGIEP